jgi:hypothetical protein
MLITLISVAIAGLIGLIAVIDADSDIAAIGTGIGLALLVFQSGATIACALACLARRRLELLALGGLLAACLAVNLFALAIWLEIDNETYAKIAGIAYVWAFFGLLVLGLALAARPLDRIARALYLGAVGASLLGGVLATALIASAGSAGTVTYASPVPYAAFGNEDLLRPLGAVFVVIATLWFGALAASRVERPAPDITR